MKLFIHKLGYQAVKSALVLLLCCSSSFALDTTNGKVDHSKADKATFSLDEIAHIIRKGERWKILDASSRHKESGSKYFRFKLLNKKGKVKVINIDPNNPNLRVIEE